MCRHQHWYKTDRAWQVTGILFRKFPDGSSLCDISWFWRRSHHKTFSRRCNCSWNTWNLEKLISITCLTLPVAYLSTYCYEHMSLFEHVVMLIKHSFHFVHASCFSSKFFIPHCYTEITSLYVVYLSLQFGQLIREHLYRTIYKCGHHCAPPTYLF